MFVCEGTPSVYTSLVSFISFLRKIFPFLGFPAAAGPPSGEPRWLLGDGWLLESLANEMFSFFYPGKCLDVVALYIRLEPSCCLPVSLSWHWVAVCSRWQNNKKKTTSEWQDFPHFLSTACQRATKVGRPGNLLKYFRVETFFFDLKRDEWKFWWNSL